MAIDVPAVPASPQSVPATSASDTADFDRRWAAWQAKGAAHDRAVRRKMAVVVPIVIVLAGILLYALLGR